MKKTYSPSPSVAAEVTRRNRESMHQPPPQVGGNALGNLYVVGQGTTASRTDSIRHWLVRKSTDGGNSWSTVDDFQQSGSSASARCVAATPNGDLYVAGTTSNSTETHWIVRKRSGGTGAWTTIDDYQFAGTYAAPHSVAADALGNLFVGGAGYDRLGGHLIVKKY